MSRHDWYRNTEWSEETASAFEAKLRRARSQKEQYLRIQAGILAELNPEVTHALLDRYFTLPNQFDAAQAHVDRACAYVAQSKIYEAIAAYDRALVREAEHPGLLTGAYLELPYLIAIHAVEAEYGRALGLLEKHIGRLMFEIDYFKWNAAKAIIAVTQRNLPLAQVHAKVALDAAATSHSGMSYHPTVGLVAGSLPEMQERMRKLCGA